MLSENDLLYLGACIIYAGGHHSKDSAIYYAKETFKDIFGDNNTEKDKMILD